MQNKLKRKLIYFLGIPLSLFFLFIVFMTCFEYTAVADIRESFSRVEQDETLAYGKVLFETRGCASCHSIKPRIKSLGPNLFKLSTRKSEEYIRQSIVDPSAVIVSGYSNVVMPNFGEILDKRQVESLVKYVSSLK